MLEMHQDIDIVDEAIGRGFQRQPCATLDQHQLQRCVAQSGEQGMAFGDAHLRAAPNVPLDTLNPPQSWRVIELRRAPGYGR
jgi:hypothetical protein